MARKTRMSQREYEDTFRYWYFNLIAYPLLLCIGIYVVGVTIETLFDYDLGVGKTIFVGIGGIGYFIWYFLKQIEK